MRERGKASSSEVWILLQSIERLENERKVRLSASTAAFISCRTELYSIANENNCAG
jgi:hypothetical protein